MGGPGKNSGEGSFIRAVDAVNLLSYGFYRFTDYKAAPGKLVPVPVYGGKKNLLPVVYPPIKKITIPRELMNEISVSLNIPHPIMAPVHEKQEVGTLVVSVRGKDIISYPVTAGISIRKGSLLKQFFDRVRLLLAGPARCRKVGS